MIGRTHAMGGILAGELLLLAGAESGGAVPSGILLAAAAAGSLVPDIDHTGSTVSRSSVVSRMVSFGVSAFSEHRRFFHTPLCLAVAALILAVLNKAFGIPYFRPAFIGFTAGYLSHLLLDSLNPTGIMWLYPFSKKQYRAAKIRTNTAQEIPVRLILTAAIIAIPCAEFSGEIQNFVKNPSFRNIIEFIS